MTAITELSGLDPKSQGDLVNLLRDAVHNGASVGFIVPVMDAELHRYWQWVATEIADGEKHLLVRTEDDVIVGAVQMSLCTKTNGMHRAEIQKLLVHSRCRRKGYGQDLMTAVEQLAVRLGHSLLVLDTEAGSPAQALYAQQGYQLLGVLPGYAASPAGGLKPCAFLYREL